MEYEKIKSKNTKNIFLLGFLILTLLIILSISVPVVDARQYPPEGDYPMGLPLPPRYGGGSSGGVVTLTYLTQCTILGGSIRESDCNANEYPVDCNGFVEHPDEDLCCVPETSTNCESSHFEGCYCIGDGLCTDFYQKDFFCSPDDCPPSGEEGIDFRYACTSDGCEMESCEDDPDCDSECDIDTPDSCDSRYYQCNSNNDCVLEYCDGDDCGHGCTPGVDECSVSYYMNCDNAMCQYAECPDPDNCPADECSQLGADPSCTFSQCSNYMCLEEDCDTGNCADTCGNQEDCAFDTVYTNNNPYVRNDVDSGTDYHLFTETFSLPVTVDWNKMVIRGEAYKHNTNYIWIKLRIDGHPYGDKFDYLLDSSDGPVDEWFEFEIDLGSFDCSEDCHDNVRTCAEGPGGFSIPPPPGGWPCVGVVVPGTCHTYSISNCDYPCCHPETVSSLNDPIPIGQHEISVWITRGTYFAGGPDVGLRNMNIDIYPDNFKHKKCQLDGTCDWVDGWGRDECTQHGECVLDYPRMICANYDTHGCNRVYWVDDPVTSQYLPKENTGVYANDGASGNSPLGSTWFEVFDKDPRDWYSYYSFLIPYGLAEADAHWTNQECGRCLGCPWHHCPGSIGVAWNSGDFGSINSYFGTVNTYTWKDENHNDGFCSSSCGYNECASGEIDDAWDTYCDAVGCGSSGGMTFNGCSASPDGGYYDLV